jgi:hypothetical protein
MGYARAGASDVRLRGVRVRDGLRAIITKLYYSRDDMLLIVTYRKLRWVLHLNSFSYFVRDIRDQNLNILTPCVVR